MEEKEVFERLKQDIISHFRKEIIWYQAIINKAIDVYVWLNINENKTMYFFTTPEYLWEDDIILFKIKSTAKEYEFNEIEDYLKRLRFEFLPILNFTPEKYEHKKDYLWEKERWIVK